MAEKHIALLGLPLHSWEEIMVWSLGAAAVAAVAVGLSTFCVIVLQRQEAAAADRALQAYKLSVATQVAGLEKEAADARLETEKVKKAFSWRQLTADNADQFYKVLATKPAAVNLRYTAGDPEAATLALQVTELLNKAGWKVAGGTIDFQTKVLYGVSIPDGLAPSVQTLRDAFQAAGVQYITAEAPNDSLELFNSAYFENAAKLIIASRSPPALQ